MEKFFSVLEGILLETGIAVKNPNFNSTLGWSTSLGSDKVHYCCPIIVMKPDSLASTDESEGTTNQSGGSTMH